MPKQTMVEERKLNPLMEQWPHLRFLGLGFWWAWRWLCFDGVEMMKLYPGSEQTTAIFYMYLFSTLAIGCSMLVAAACWKKVTRLIDSRAVVCLFGLLAGVSTIFLGFLPLLGLDSMFVVFAVCTGLGTSFLCLRMGRVYGSASLSDLLTAAGISLILAACLYFVGIGFPMEGRIFYIGALPVLSALFFFLKGPDQLEGFGSESETADAVRVAGREAFGVKTAEREVLIRLTIAAGLVSLIAGIGKGLSMNLGSETVAQAGVEIIIAIVGIAVLMIIAINKQSLRRGVYQIYSGLMLLGVVLLLASSFGLPLTYLAIFKEPLWVVLSCFMAYIAFRYDISPIWVFGIGQATYFLCSTAGWVIGFLVSDNFYTSNLLNVSGVVLAFLVLLVLLYVFNGKDLSKITSPSARDALSKSHVPGKNQDEGIGAQAADASKAITLTPAARSRLGLSEREGEVIELFAQGRSATWIADTFMISTSTVRSHIRAVYVKTGVHSRQELLDFLSGEKN